MKKPVLEARSFVFLVLGLAGIVTGGCSGEGEDKGEDKGPGGCLIDADCLPGRYCHVRAGQARGVCLQGCRLEPGSCGIGGVCSAQHTCEAVVQPCQETGCEGDLCPSAAGVCFCNEATGRCEPGCVDDSGCTLPCTVCDTATHRCQEARGCSQDEDCPAGSFCDPAGCGECRPGCRSFRDCPAETPYCVEHSCRNCPDCPVRCEAGAADPARRCPEDRFCNEQSLCEPRCVSDAGCRGTLGPGYICCLDAGCSAPRCTPACQEEGERACPAVPEGDLPFYCGEDGHCHTGCREDRDCDAPERCLGGRCREGCREDAECPEPGTFCDPATFGCRQGCSELWPCPPLQSCAADHTCQPLACAQDGQCPELAAPGSYCDTAAGICQAGCRDDEACAAPDTICDEEHACSPACHEDRDCPEERFCRGDGHCVLGCRDDDREPNGSSQQASPLELADGRFTANQLVLCAGDEDWYLLEPAGPRSCEAVIRFEPALGAPNLALLASDGVTQLANAEPTGPGELRLVLPSTGEAEQLYLRLRAAGAGAGAGAELPLRLLYDLEVLLVEQPVCSPDWAEQPEPNDGWDEATSIHDGLQEELRLCPADEDWFAFQLAEGDRLTATVSWEDAEQVLRLELLFGGGDGPRLVALGAEPVGQPGVRRVEVPMILESGVYRLAVQAPQGVPAGGLPYRLDLAPVRLNPLCWDDEQEDNDGPLSPTLLPGPLDGTPLPGLELCPDDEDWFQVEVEQGDTLRIALTRDLAWAPPAIEVYRGGELIAQDSSGQQNAQLRLDGLDEGPYLVRVFGQEGGWSRYTLAVQASLEACVEDDREPDGEPVRASVIDCGGSVANLVACAGDDDYLRVELPSYGAVIATASFPAGTGPVDLALLDRNGGALVLLGTLGEGTMTVERHGLDAGRYLLRASTAALRPVRYALRLDCVEEVPPCPPDAFEPNSTSAQAAPIQLPRSDGEEGFAQLVLEDLRICNAADEDWFRFTTRVGDRLDIFCEFFHFQGDLALELYCSAGFGADVLVASSNDIGNNERIVHDMSAQTTCRLRVRGVPIMDTGTPYTLTFQQVD